VEGVVRQLWPILATAWDSIMADRQECRCRVLILGHSFVTWLGDFLDEEAVELGGQMVAWCRIGGAMVATLRAELGRQNVENYSRLHCVSPTWQSASLTPRYLCPMTASLSQMSVAVGCAHLMFPPVWSLALIQALVTGPSKSLDPDSGTACLRIIFIIDDWFMKII